MVNGYNPACIFILPMLGREPDEYPRFRDCFIEDDKIAVYTRVGGPNRNCGYGEEKLFIDPNFIRSYDDDYDSTYGTYLFRVPKTWKSDFDKIIDGKLKETSDEYKQYIKEFWPRLATLLTDILG
jgi:hypothetical protein